MVISSFRYGFPRSARYVLCVFFAAATPVFPALAGGGAAVSVGEKDKLEAVERARRGEFEQHDLVDP